MVAGVTKLDTAAWVSRDAKRDRRFFGAMVFAAAVTTFVGFAPTYYLKPAYGTAVLPLIVHVHGLLFSAWIVLLAVQVSLISAHRRELHYRLGIAGFALAAVMTVIAPVIAIGAIRRGAMPLTILAVQMASAVVFPILVGAAFVSRRTGDTHKRLILLATVELLTAPVGRLPVVRDWGALGDYGVADLFVVALVAYDFASRRRIHPATLWGGMFLVGSQFLRDAIRDSGRWLSFVRWLIS